MLNTGIINDCEYRWLIKTCILCSLCSCHHMSQTLMEGKGDKATAEGMELLRKEVEKLKEELETTGDGQY